MATGAYSQLTAIIRAFETSDCDMSCLHAELARLAHALDHLGEQASAEQDFNDLVDSVRAARAGIEIAPALKAIDTLRHLPRRQTDDKAEALCRSIAIARLCAAAPLVVGMREVDGPVVEVRPAQGPEVTIDSPVDAAIRRNIAIYHREHERFYSWQCMLDAADICREANRLKTIASLWIDEVPLVAPEADFSDPRVQAAGCVDLNALRAIAGIGILFMEGENEPAEIAGIKAKLRVLGPTWKRAGLWLAEKMEAAWSREYFLVEEGSIDAAESRLAIIVTNWRGSRQMSLSGQLLEIATNILDALDLRPASVRTNRTASGERLLRAGWVLDLAAQLVAREAADLSENEMRWTRYLEVTSTNRH